MRPGPYPAHSIGHPLSELSDRLVSDRRQERVAVGEVPVGGIGHHAHHPCRFTQYDGVWAAGAGQLQPGGDQAVADGTSRTVPSLRDSLVFRLS